MKVYHFLSLTFYLQSLILQSWLISIYWETKKTAETKKKLSGSPVAYNLISLHSRDVANLVISSQLKGIYNCNKYIIEQLTNQLYWFNLRFMEAPGA